MPVAGVQIRRTLVDNRSSVNVLYFKTLEQMGIPKRYCNPTTKVCKVLLVISLKPDAKLPCLWSWGCSLSKEHYCRLCSSGPTIHFNAILGYPILYELKVAISIYHYCMKFSIPRRVEIVLGDQTKASLCNIDLPRAKVNMFREI